MENIKDKEKYGNRNIKKMYTEFNNHRIAVASGDLERIQETFDKIESWIDFSFGKIQ